MNSKQWNKLKRSRTKVLITNKNGIDVVRKQTIDEKYAEKIVQYYNNGEFENTKQWDEVGRKIKFILQSYKRAIKNGNTKRTNL